MGLVGTLVDRVYKINNSCSQVQQAISTYYFKLPDVGSFPRETQKRLCKLIQYYCANVNIKLAFFLCYSTLQPIFILQILTYLKAMQIPVVTFSRFNEHSSHLFKSLEIITFFWPSNFLFSHLYVQTSQSTVYTNHLFFFKACCKKKVWNYIRINVMKENKQWTKLRKKQKNVCI